MKLSRLADSQAVEAFKRAWAGLVLYLSGSKAGLGSGSYRLCWPVCDCAGIISF